MKTALQQVAFRKNALLVPTNEVSNTTFNQSTSILLANSYKLGYTFSEDLLLAINTTTPSEKLNIYEFLKDVTGINKNWTPLVKQWDVPTNETRIDHVITWFSNLFQVKNGTQLPCGHTIPKNTFPLEKYNGCPFCGTPFEFEQINYKANPNKTKVLKAWTEKDLYDYFINLLSSPVVLDATQIDDLKILMSHFEVSTDIEIKVKETIMVVTEVLVAHDQSDKAQSYFKTPTDVLRYLWYQHTGFLQIIEPKTITNRINKNAVYPEGKAKNDIKSKGDLKLKFSRSECKMYANWLTNLPGSTTEQAENMHPKRNIWVRVIRSLRLNEYSKRKGFENLAQLLDVFYNEKYTVWQGEVNSSKLKMDEERTFKLLKERPGLFARSLFSTMLWFGPEKTINHFKEIIEQLPPKLVFTLNMYAELYFDKNGSRMVKPLGGINKKIPVNKLLQWYTDNQLKKIQVLIQNLCLEHIKNKFINEKNVNKTIYIDNALFNIPIAIGDRSEHIQDANHALMGTKFKIEGDTVRLFMQWGEGLPAQHLDMDLSCQVAYVDKTEFCSYSQLTIPGCKHSGDIQQIPHQVGTAEYIDVNFNELNKLGANYVSLTCNSYTAGSIVPNLVMGWMNSKSKMKISSNGVAYNPADVQHQVRIKQSLSKGIVFGVLDVKQKEIIWLEMSFGGQVVQNLSVTHIESLIKKLSSKLKIGDLLQLKAEVQNLEIVSEPEIADEIYDQNWALDSSQVSALFL